MPLRGLRPSTFLFALILTSACSAEPKSAEDVADLIVAKEVTDCPAMKDADGWMEATERPSSGGASLKTVTVTDRRRLKQFTLEKRSDAGGTFEFSGDTETPTLHAYCSVENADRCSLQVETLLPPTPDEKPIKTTDAYRMSGAFDQPGHGGAALVLDHTQSDVPDTAWKLSVTPPGGVPYSLYVARDGAILAIDAPFYNSKHPGRTTVLEWKDFGDCHVPSKVKVQRLDEDIIPGFGIEIVTTAFEPRPKLNEADTPTEGEVRLPS